MSLRALAPTFRRALTLLLFAALVMPGIALGAIVAVVTDLEGRAREVADGRTRELTILAALDQNAVVELDPGTKLVALYLDVSDEYAFEGPARITFGSARPAVVQGSAPARRALSSGMAAQRLRIKPLGVTQAGIILRGPVEALPDDATLRAQVAAFRPAESAALSQRVAYALWLDQMGLRSEARAYWKQASAERADDARLRAIAE